MRYLLDTNSCIYLFANAYPALTQRVAGLPVGSLAISVITYAELALGVRNAKPPPRRLLEGFVEEIEVVPFETAAAEAYARMPFPRGNLDRLIAAHAISLDVPLVTRNAADFANIPGLKIENWTEAA